MAKKRKKKEPVNTDPIVRELDAVKRLLMLQLANSGVKPSQIAIALGVDKSVVSRTLPVRKLGLTTGQ